MSDIFTYGLNYFILVEEINFPLCGMNVDVYPLRVNLETEIYEGVPVLGKECGVCLFQGFLDMSRLHATVVYEK